MVLNLSRADKGLEDTLFRDTDLPKLGLGLLVLTAALATLVDAFKTFFGCSFGFSTVEGALAALLDAEGCDSFPGLKVPFSVLGFFLEVCRDKVAFFM